MKVGTRDSRLAMAQTELFAEAIRSKNPDIRLEVVPMKTSGDLDLKSELCDMGGYGAFVRELDTALMDGIIDVSVNSMKDVPVMRNESIVIPAVLPRASVEDVILPVPLADLGEGAVVGTSSIRRAAALREIRPDITVRPLRGNISTRLSKLDRGEYDAVILAKAGLERLEAGRSMHTLDISDFTPAPAQGAIAVACKASDAATIDVLRGLNDETAYREVTAERTIMRMMGAGCSSPIGICARHKDDGIVVKAVSYESGVAIRSVRKIPFDYKTEDLEHIARELGGME